MVILRKTIAVMKGEEVASTEIRYYFYITNDQEMTPPEVVFDANDRCDQENLIGQLKSGMKALRMPLDNLYSNWVYLITACLAWTLKSWSALILPLDENDKEKASKRRKLLTMEFVTFLQAMIMIPAQILHSGRRVIVRFLNMNFWTETFFELNTAVRLILRE